MINFNGVARYQSSIHCVLILLDVRVGEKIRKNSHSNRTFSNSRIFLRNLNGHSSQILQFLAAFAKLRKASTSFIVSLCSLRLSAWNNSASTGRSFMTSYVGIIKNVFGENPSFINI